MEGRALPQYSTNSVFMLPNEDANEAESRHTSITPPYFKSEPLDEAQGGKKPEKKVEFFIKK